MVRVRKLVLAIAAASALTSSMAHALGLGEISLKSALNQPLDAEIELLEVRDLGGNEVLPSLAAVEEFNKVGVDRPYFLTDLKFTPVLKPNGKSVIRVTSSKPVREPYLNFLIEVLWPNGRLLREYTVLLDPPLYSPQTVVAATPRLPQAAPVAPRVSAPAPVSRPQPSASAPAAPAAAPVASSAASRLEGDQYRVGRDDTLWEVAERARPSSALSVHQTMLAIQDLNPNAFLDGNINRMKSGQVLRLPSEQQIRSRSQADALAQVAAQNSAWREGRAVQPVAAAARQLDATRRSEAGNAPAQAPAEDNLRLVSAASGKSTSGSDSGAAADSQGLADKLALNQESLATSQRENQELKERLGDLQSQLDKLQRLIELKNEQLAKLQGGLAADAATTAAADSAPAAEAEVAPVAAAAVQPAGESATEAPLENKPQADAADAAAAPASVAEPAADTAAPVAAESKPAPVAEAPKPAPAKPAVQPVAPAPVYEPSLVDEVLANPLLLAAGGGALALLAGLGLLAGSRRKARKQAEDEAQLFQEVGELPGANGVTSAGAESVEAALSAQGPAAAGGAPLASADPLGEAEMYSTYGRFTQAAEILRNAVNDEPQRADLRLKLMEVYAEMGDREGFVRQEAELGEIGGAQPQID
ncbi:MAG TPA: FimV/HubP family polar landmark protein, partial [Pseudomonas sp.]